MDGSAWSCSPTWCSQFNRRDVRSREKNNVRPTDDEQVNYHRPTRWNMSVA